MQARRVAVTDFLLPFTTTAPVTVALVIVWLRASFIGRWPSPTPHMASGKMRNSLVGSLEKDLVKIPDHELSPHVRER